MQFLSAIEDYFVRFGMLCGDHGWNFGLENSSFFAGDFGKGVAEEIFVVEVDAGDDGDGGLNDVGGIEAAAEPDFEDGEVDFFFCEILEGHGGDAFEIGGVGAEFSGGEESFDLLLGAGEDGGEIFVGDFLAVDAEAFVDFFEVGRSVEAGAQAGVAEDGFEKCGGRTFAVGAGDVCGRIGAAGVAEGFVERRNIFEMKFCGGGLRGGG